MRRIWQILTLGLKSMRRFLTTSTCETVPEKFLEIDLKKKKKKSRFVVKVVSLNDVSELIAAGEM